MELWVSVAFTHWITIADISQFIEIGNSLYISDKVPPKALVANANVKLRSAIPKAIETFHQALDDIETDIVDIPISLESTLLS